MRWSKEKAWAWHKQYPWHCGFNYLPRTAVNYTDFWLSFDEQTIAQELRWANKIGFNSVRVVLSYVVWKHDPEALLKKIDRFLAIAQASNIVVMLTPLDDCGFSGLPSLLEAKLTSVPNVHNSRAMASPGREVVLNRPKWPQVLAYVQEVVQAFSQDERVLLWDLYNEPGNRMIFTADGTQLYDQALEMCSHDLMLDVFDTVRHIDPIQPLTVGGWHVPPPWEEVDGDLHTHPTDIKAFELSDIVSFHAYCSTQRLNQIIANLQKYDRPIMCTEWMARHVGSNIETQLPIYREWEIDCYQWGLVKGDSQTHLPWPDVRKNMGDRNAAELWFHDLLDQDGSIKYDHEAQFLRSFFANNKIV